MPKTIELKDRRFRFLLTAATDEQMDRLKTVDVKYIAYSVVERSCGRAVDGFVILHNQRTPTGARNYMALGCAMESANSCQVGSFELIRQLVRSGRGKYTERGQSPLTADQKTVLRTIATDAGTDGYIASRPLPPVEWTGFEDVDNELRSSAATSQHEEGFVDDAEEDAGTTSRRGAQKARQTRILEILEKNCYDPLSVYRVDPFLYANHLPQIERICKAAKSVVHDQTPRTWKTKVYLASGSPGSGKTLFATRLVKTLGLPSYYKDTSKWWPGYCQQPVVVLDEYNDWFEWGELLMLMSQLPHTVSVKHGEAVYNARHLIITTSRHPETWYDGQRGFERKALMDRVDFWTMLYRPGETMRDGTLADGYVQKKMVNYRDERRKFETLDDVEPLDFIP